MNWIKINNIRWKKIENILFVIAILSLIGLTIVIFSMEKLKLEGTLIVGILTAFVSTMEISATIKQSSKNTFINTITIARKEYMAELRKAVEEFCVTAERSDNEKLKELSYNLNSAVFFLVRKFYMLRCLFGVLYVDMRCFGVSWVFSKHKIPHPNQWGSMKNHKEILFIQ